MKKVFALILVAVMLVTLFAGCSTLASGAESVLDAVDAFYDAVSSGHYTTMSRLFLYDHFPSESKSNQIASGILSGTSCVAYHAVDLRVLPFYGERNSVCVGTEEIGQNRNDAEMSVLSQTIYEESGIKVSLQEQIFIQASFVTGTDSYNTYVQAVKFGTEQERSQFSDPYEFTFDIVCIDDRYYIRSVSFWLDEPIWDDEQKTDGGGGKATTANKSQVSTTVQGYTLEEVKANYNGTGMGNGFYIKKGELFYPCAEGGFVTGTGPIFDVVTSGDELPRLDHEAGDQLVCFAPFAITSLPVAKSTHHGKTIPVCLCQEDYYSSGYTKLTFVPDNSLYNLNRDKIESSIKGRDDSEAIEEFFDDLESWECVIAQIYDNEAYYAFRDTCWADIASLYDEEESFEVGDTDNWTDDYDSDYWRATFLLSFVENAEVPLEYYVGSQYKQITFPAIIDYWYIPLNSVYSDGVYNVPLSTTKDGYYIVDTEAMERGTYAIYNAVSTDWNSYPYYDKGEHAILYEDWVYDENLYYETVTIFSVQ